MILYFNILHNNSLFLITFIGKIYFDNLNNATTETFLISRDELENLYQLPWSHHSYLIACLTCVNTIYQSLTTENMQIEL